ncbi:hypothetical protein [Marivita sp.]|uniref:hypothetical protein n=1 Tax=Marivita sp. TaxID=2003365 RepID=UPI003A83E5BB
MLLLQYDPERLRQFFRQEYDITQASDRAAMTRYMQHVKELTLGRFPDATGLPNREINRVDTLCESKTAERRHEKLQMSYRAIISLLNGADTKPIYNMSAAKLYPFYLLSRGCFDPTIGEVFRTSAYDWPGEITLSLQDRSETRFDVTVLSNDLNDGGTRHDIVVTAISLQDGWVQLHTSDGKPFATLDFGFRKYTSAFQRMDGDALDPKSAPPPMLQDGDFVDMDNTLNTSSVISYSLNPKKRGNTVRKVWNVNSLEHGFEVATCVTFADTQLRVAVTAPMEEIEISVMFSAQRKKEIDALSGRQRRDKEENFNKLARENLASHLMRSLLLETDGDTYLGNALIHDQRHDLISAPALDLPEDHNDPV